MIFSDFIWKLAMAAAIVGVLFALGGHEQRIEKLEQPVLACPANCVPIQHLLSNRPIPTGPGAKHSFAKPFRTCEEP